MKTIAVAWLLAASLMGSLLGSGAVHAQDLSLIPKFGNTVKTEAQIEADNAFIARMAARYGGDTLRAAKDLSDRGWILFRRDEPENAMRLFNQAWLVDPRVGDATWGMAAIASGRKNLVPSLGLYQEAERLLPDNIDLAVDHARTIGLLGRQSGNVVILDEAVRRHQEVFNKRPDHTMNLQNWAVLSYARRDYAAAWEKLKLAEATPGKAAIDPDFVRLLESKMPRPPN